MWRLSAQLPTQFSGHLLPFLARSVPEGEDTMYSFQERGFCQVDCGEGAVPKLRAQGLP